MTIFCQILTAHNTDCVSLSSLVQNMLISYILIMFVVSFILSKVKSNSNPIKLLQDSYLKHKYETFVIDLIYLGFVFSMTFLIYRILSVELFINRNVKISPFILYTIILSSMIIISSMLSGLLINYGSTQVKSLKKWSKYGWKAIIFDLIFFNIVSLVGYSIMLLGYSNILVAPTYVGLALKFLM